MRCLLEADRAGDSLWEVQGQGDTFAAEPVVPREIVVHVTPKTADCLALASDHHVDGRGPIAVAVHEAVLKCRAAVEQRFPNGLNFFGILRNFCSLKM